MTLEQYQDYVNTYIATNGRNAITGNVMNTILQEIGDRLYSALTGLTIGSTDITSGVDGRLLRNDLGKVGQTNYTVPKLDGTAGQVLQTNGSGTVSWVTISSGLTVGTTPISSGTDGRILFQSGGALSQDSNLFWDNTNKRFGVGATPASTVRLDVRAQGSSSTDSVIRIRNSANNDDIFQAFGNMSLNLLGTFTGGYINVSRTTGGNVRMRHRATATLPSIFQIHSFGDGGSIGQIQFDAFDGNTPAFTVQRLISGLSDLTGASLYSGFGTNAATFVMKNALNYGSYGVIPTGTAADHFAMYSADIVAGNAAPHFRTENGSIIKLYKQDLPTTPTTGEIATLLSNLGFANLI